MKDILILAYSLVAKVLFITFCTGSISYIFVELDKEANFNSMEKTLWGIAIALTFCLTSLLMLCIDENQEPLSKIESANQCQSNKGGTQK